MKKALLTFALIASVLAAAPAGAGDVPDAIAAAVGHADRPDADKTRDAARKPDKVLAFFGIAPGMTVLDLFAGGGFYTEILARLVGPDGKVTAHNNHAYLNYARKDIGPRYADGRLAEVERVTIEANELELEENSYDAVLMILTYHDIYLTSEPEDWPVIDGPRLLGAIVKGLKPGGVLGIVDHRARAGAPATTGDSLHRIDPEIVKTELAAAGLVFEGAADFLANPEDDLDKPMYAEGIRGKTDRFVFRFRKPEG